jgi:hypothetical protein
MAAAVVIPNLAKPLAVDALANGAALADRAAAVATTLYDHQTNAAVPVDEAAAATMILEQKPRGAIVKQIAYYLQYATALLCRANLSS